MFLLSALFFDLTNDDGEDLPNPLSGMDCPITLDRFSHTGRAPVFLICHWRLEKGEKCYEISVMDKALAAKGFVSSLHHNPTAGVDKVYLLASPSPMTDKRWLLEKFVDVQICSPSPDQSHLVSYITDQRHLLYPAQDMMYNLSYNMTVRNAWPTRPSHQTP